MPQKDGKHRHPDESLTLFSIGRIDKVYHKVLDSSREKQVESLRKTECFYHVIQTEAPRHFDRSGEISTNNNCKFFLIIEISRFHFIPLSSFVVALLRRTGEMTNAGTYLLLDDLDLTSQERSESGVKNIRVVAIVKKSLNSFNS